MERVLLATTIDLISEVSFVRKACVSFSFLVGIKDVSFVRVFFIESTSNHRIAWKYYSLHPILIDIFQKLKYSKIIATFAIGMDCSNK